MNVHPQNAFTVSKKTNCLKYEEVDDAKRTVDEGAQLWRDFRVNKWYWDAVLREFT
jgi:hypothetical protein